MIKHIPPLLLLLGFSLFSQAQTTVNLDIKHKFEKSSFSTGQVYIDGNNRVLQIDRVQYYISNILLTHDAGQLTPLNDLFLLVDGTQRTYTLGTVAQPIEALENIEFDLGIDASINQTTPVDYVSSHALAPKVPTMYSDNQNSYIFIVLEGKIDTDNDNNPDQAFSLRVTNSQLLQHVSLESNRNVNDNNTLTIELQANVANWLEDIGLDTVGTQENDSDINATVMENTTDYTVFTSPAATSVQALVSPQNHIYVDGRLPQRPTIYYKFYTGEQVDMTITNVTGTYFIQRFGLSPEGDFFMNDDLASGIYIVVFTSPRGIRQCKKFVINR